MKGAKPCCFEGRTRLLLLSHYRTIHRDDDNFDEPCLFAECHHTSKFKTESGLRKHLENHHNELFLPHTELGVGSRRAEEIQSQLQESEPASIDTGTEGEPTTDEFILSTASDKPVVTMYAIKQFLTQFLDLI